MANRCRRRSISGRSSDEGEKHPSADIASITSDDLGTEVVGGLLRRGRPAVLLDQLALGPGDPGLGLLHPARRPHGPAEVAEVLLQLAADRGHGVREEVLVPARVEVAGGTGQGGVGDLDQVVLLDAAVEVAAGDAAGDAHVDPDDVVEQLLAAGLAARGAAGGQRAGGALAALASRQGRFNGKSDNASTLTLPEKLERTCRLVAASGVWACVPYRTVLRRRARKNPSHP